MSFESVLNTHPWQAILDRVSLSTRRDVEAALNHEKPGLKEFVALLSPAAEPFLESMAKKAHRITRCRFGRVIQMYVPLYLGNECTNSCLYCGFSRQNQIKRRTLTFEEAIHEGNLLLDQGFRHLLLVSGESPRHVSAETISKVVKGFKGGFASVAIEVQPMSTEDYGMLIEHGVDSLVSYQETYNRSAYGAFHPKGPKKDFSFRLATAERGGAAGFRRVG
ncbi:MAG: radical SAM protein, partial [Planctomycetota bacterium]